MTDPHNEFVFAGADMTGFTQDWLAGLDQLPAESTGLLDLALHDPVRKDRYFYGAGFVMQNIGPRAGAEHATADELRLFAVLAAYQQDDHPGADPTVWDGILAHTRRAFDHANALGSAGVAHRLRQNIIDRATRQDPPEFTAMMNRSMNNDPARRAAHERNMASILHRDIRAANLIDPEGESEFDLQLLQARP
ncbi:hypothetical protein AB0M43_37580 [Longispora sp. NPDC051575]|uniref:hypothetical protein n=1 Tax=Longispora sp. NPDC051575 TaxID=3154943 RepID=UPI00341CC539